MISIRATTDLIELDISAALGPTRERRFGVLVKRADFQASEVDLFLEGEEFDGFLKDLRLVERDRKGEATLSTEDPRQFQLKVAVIDKAGHVTISGRLASYEGAEGKAVLEFAFPFDPSALAGVLQDFERLDAAA